MLFFFTGFKTTPIILKKYTQTLQDEVIMQKTKKQRIIATGIIKKYIGMGSDFVGRVKDWK